MSSQPLRKLPEKVFLYKSLKNIGAAFEMWYDASEYICRSDHFHHYGNQKSKSETLRKVIQE